jgi:hypothetical protein
MREQKLLISLRTVDPGVTSVDDRSSTACNAKGHRKPSHGESINTNADFPGDSKRVPPIKKTNRDGKKGTPHSRQPTGWLTKLSWYASR